MKGKLTILFLCLLVLGFAQNECQESRIALLQTGEIILNPNDLTGTNNTNIANKNYYESLERGKFGKTDFLGYAFAIAGLETSCSQQYYSLVVDVVQFQNENTKMRIVIDFRNTALDTITTWTKVKLTYLVVSAEKKQQGQPQANIWATSAEVSFTGAPAAGTVYFRDDIFAGIDGSGAGCGLTYDAATGYNFNVNCDSLISNTEWDRDVAIHAYIMGFRYEPDTNGNGQFLAASANWNSWPSSSQKQLATPDNTAISDKANDARYGVRIVYDVSPLVNNGPRFALSNYGGELKSVKIAIVLTTVNSITDANGGRNGFDTVLAYSYSGLYNPVPTTAYNIRTLIDNVATQDYNNLHENLPLAKYKIYGFSRFELKDGSGCTSFNIDLSIDTPNSYTLTLNNKDYFHDIVFQSDIFFPATNNICSPGAQFSDLFWDLEANPAAASTQLANAQAGSIGNLKYMKTRKSQRYTTVPSNNLFQYINQIKDNPLDLKFFVNGIAGDTTNVRLNAQVVLSGITSGKPYGIRVYLKPDSTVAGKAFHAATDSTLYQFAVKVNGLNLYTKSFTGTRLTTLANSALNTDKSQERYGVNLAGDSAKFEYSLIIPRKNVAGHDYTFEIHVDLFQFVQVYDPVTQCCVSKCPANNGLDVQVTPPVCVVCDVAKGLTYDPASGSCKCADTFYLSSKLNFQCFPCQTKLCASCDSTNPKKCVTCLSGASLSTLDSTCSCISGFYENNGVCNACPAKCKTCKVASTCDTCSDTNRDFNNNCNCVAGYYDAGVDRCQKCNPSCATCSNANTCVTCDTRKFRTIKNGLCVCQDGYFELIYENGNKQCKPCSKECKTCIESAIQCTSCDATINRIEGYDSLNHRTCICRSGYHALPDASCVQSNCKTDEYCSQCEKDLALCVQCRATLNRVLKLPENICVCGDGFYEDTTSKTCKPCADGCAQCSSLTKCTACVAGATNNNDGTCKCATGTFFGIATNGVRYCQKCLQYCDKCSDALTCQTCKSPFQLSSDKTCFCPKTNWINPNGDCVPCKVGCETCSSSTTCSKCVAPLVVQQDNCVAKCSDGYFLSGSTCVGCPKNCVGCTSTNQCFYCKDGFFLHGGSCYTSCPSGTVANTQTFQCIPCNSPCRTCTNHPSTCTSCEPGEGYLQVTGENQRCVKQCAEGTFPKDNVCRVCDFRCAKCLGAANNCIACPAGRYLYNGACWDYCPGVMVNNSCVNQCPAGYWRVSDQQCKPCNSECRTCDSNSTCLTCSNNFLSLNGKCVAQCGSGYYSFRGICVACDKSCKSCRNNPTQCTQCARGFVRLNERCVSTCQQGTYLDNVQGACRACSSTCKTCSSQNFCLSCPNANILPVGGQCLSCIYPCDTCSKDLSVCNSCLSGFYLSNGQCLRSCPSGTRPANGVCSCASGIFLDGSCVSSCPAGFTKVGNSCRRCSSPCTECSGNQNFCTDCLDTYTLKPNIGKCEQTSSCNYGQEEVNSKCERICDQGSYYQNGACIFGGCPDEFKDNGFGGCVASSSNSNVCQVPTFRLNGVCVQDCGRTYFPNSNTRTCDTCSSSCQNCLNRNFCVTCATGFTSIDGRCVANSNCTSTQFSYNSVCVTSCPAGTFTVNGRCVRSCATGSFYFGGWCYDTCPTQARYYTDNACVSTCPTGTTLIDGVCATIV